MYLRDDCIYKEELENFIVFLPKVHSIVQHKGCTINRKFKLWLFDIFVFTFLILTGRGVHFF